MRRWYESRRDRPDLERSAIRKRGFVGYMDMLWREFFELLKLNLLFVLSCVPIITIPAALTAMHRITSVMVRDENHFLWPDYWKAFRRDFWKSLGGGAAIAAVMALFVLSTVFYYNLMQVNKVFVLLAGFAACVVLLTLCVSFYFFPMLAMVDLPLGALLKNSMALVFGNIGKTLLRGHEEDLSYRMRAYAAAASDARMNGCEMPVVINSGSGNQGITSSVPVIVCARATGRSHEELLRALAVANLVTIHLKTGIGRLSAYCGAVSAGCGAAAGLAYLQGGDYDTVAHTVVNTVAMDSGIICDGAKASCAAKIAAAVDAGLLGLAMYRSGNQFFGGDGIVKKGVENTIANVGRLARLGMAQTDKQIIQLMMES